MSEGIAEEIAKLDQYIQTMQRDQARPVEQHVVLYPAPSTWGKDEKVIERLQMFGPMNIYPSKDRIHCVCQSAEMAKEMIATRRIVVEGETYGLYRVIP